MPVFRIKRAILACTLLASQSALAEDFTITITAPAKGTVPTVTASGTSTSIISVDDRVNFGITFWPLDSAITKQIGLGPKAIYTSDPTQNGNIFAEFGWQPTTVTTNVTNTSVSVPQEEVQTLATHVFCNTLSTKGTFTASLNASTTNSVTSGWSSSFSLSDALTAKIDAEFPGGSVSASDTVTVTTVTGKSASASAASTVGSSQSVSVTLKPGEKALAVLSAQKGTVQVTITYTKSLSGTVFANYDPTYEGHHFYDFPIETLMANINLPTEKSFTQTINLDYYHSGQVVLQAYDGPCNVGTEKE